MTVNHNDLFLMVQLTISCQWFRLCRKGDNQWWPSSPTHLYVTRFQYFTLTHCEKMNPSITKKPTGCRPSDLALTYWLWWNLYFAWHWIWSHSNQDACCSWCQDISIGLWAYAKRSRIMRLKNARRALWPWISNMRYNVPHSMKWFLGPLLLTWINFDISIDKKSHAQ